MRRRANALAWRSFDPRDVQQVERQLRLGAVPKCPCCSTALETRARTRAALTLPPGARGFDVQCRCCQRFLSRVADSPESIYFMRVQRLASAVLRA